MEALVDKFDATTETGVTKTFYVYQTIIRAGTYDDPNATVRGLLRVVDQDGHAVNVIGHGQYEIVALRLKASGRAIRKIPE